jgi:hypothetical protein
VFKGLLDSPPTAPAAAITYGNAISNLWPSGAIDSAGNIYAVWATNSARPNTLQTGTSNPSTTIDIWFTASHDGGKTFVGPWKVSSGTGTSVFPWIAAGDAGRVDIVWYQSSNVGPPLVASDASPGSLTGGSNNMPATSTWNLMFAQSLNADTREPVFSVTQAGDHVMHTGSISTGGLTGIFNDRSLGDFFEVGIGPDGLANIAFTDTSVSPNVIAFTRQNGGPLALTNPTSPTCLPGPPVPAKIISRKTHGSGGTYDVDLPLTGERGIECRSGGANGEHDIVVTWAAPTTFASVTTACGTVSASSNSGNDTTIHLTGVANAQCCAITFANANDGAGAIGDVTVPICFLAGDTTGDGNVNSADIAQTKSQSGQPMSSSNFRQDLTVDGNINSADISFSKSKSGTALPP